MKITYALVIFLISAATAPAVTMDMVAVGNPGNAPDTRLMTCCGSSTGTFGFGSVGYSYRIAKYELTTGQYTEFLNAVAKEDPNGLYNAGMGTASTTDPHIQRIGASPDYSYSVALEWANRPINNVTFWDAVRFANWLHNGQPTGAQGPGTTEAGAYHNVGNSSLFGRNPGATFFIPTEDEWYKAAYHKNDGITGNYWTYPTATNTAPVNTLPDPGNHANFYDDVGTGNHGYTIGSPYYRTEAGAFVKSASPYGTFDQGGNVEEFNETKSGSASRGVRGGSFTGVSSDLAALTRSNTGPADASFNVGFRVAAIAIPEPTRLGVIATSVLACLITRRRRIR